MEKELIEIEYAVYCIFQLISTIEWFFLQKCTGIELKSIKLCCHAFLIHLAP